MSVCVTLQCYTHSSIVAKNALRKFQYRNHEHAEKVSALGEKKVLLLDFCELRKSMSDIPLKSQYKIVQQYRKKALNGVV